MSAQPPLSPTDAPFDITTIPTGRTVALTQEEADAANVLYPVPPYGATYTNPNPPPGPGPNVVFVKMTNVIQGLETQANMSNEDMDKIELDDIIVIWPIACVVGVADEVGARPVRILTKADEKVTFNWDSTGIDITGMVLVGVNYVGP